MLFKCLYNCNPYIYPKYIRFNLPFIGSFYIDTIIFWLSCKSVNYFTVVIQNYVTEAENEYVIRGNTAIVKCKIPSFVADFVSVDAWIADSDTTFTAHTLFNTNNNDCKSP